MVNINMESSKFNKLYEAYIIGNQTGPNNYPVQNDDKNSFAPKDQLPTTQPSGSKRSFVPSENEEQYAAPSIKEKLDHYLRQLQQKHTDPQCAALLIKIQNYLHTLH